MNMKPLDPGEWTLMTLLLLLGVSLCIAALRAEASEGRSRARWWRERQRELDRLASGHCCKMRGCVGLPTWTCGYCGRGYCFGHAGYTDALGVNLCETCKLARYVRAPGSGAGSGGGRWQ